MITRAVALAFGLAGGLGMAQFPEFSQQYVQRLGGAVDALAQVVADFDRSAQAEGLTRDQALKAMTGTAFVERRRDDMARTISRADRLTNDLTVLQAAGAWQRLALAPTALDRDLARETAAAFRPAVPGTVQGLSFAVVGFGLGLVLAYGLALPFRGRRRQGPFAQQET